MSTEDAPSISDEWLSWMRDFSIAAEQLTREEPVDIAPENHELISLKMALFARGLTLFQGALLLAEHDRLLDFRIHARSVIEAVIFMIVLDSDPTFVQKMKNDDYKNRRSRAELHLAALSPEVDQDVRRMLEEFTSESTKGLQKINMNELLKGSEFERLYRTYRDISGDAAHVSIESLNRHYVEGDETKFPVLIIHPTLGAMDLYITLAELGISVVIAVLMLMKIKKQTSLWDHFRALLARYNEISQKGRLELSAAPDSGS